MNYHVLDVTNENIICAFPVIEDNKIVKDLTTNSTSELKLFELPYKSIPYINSCMYVMIADYINENVFHNNIYVETNKTIKIKNLNN